MPAPEIPPRLRQQLDNATEAFVQCFQRRPTFAAVAPGRVNLIGEHTDYNDGFVLPMAIDRQTVIVADRCGRDHRDHSECWAIDLNESEAFDLTRPLSPKRGRAVNFLLGVADQFQKQGHKPPNLDCLVTSSVPIGAGLSSSAAIEVAFATLLEQVLHVELEPLEKAQLCQRAEHAFPGTPCGIMDMYVASMARPGHAMFIDCRSLRAQFIPMPPEDEAALLIIDTGVKHQLATSAYADRRAACAAAAAKLGVASLRDATVRMLQNSKLSAIEYKRCLHVIAENSRTVLAAEALGRGDLSAFGDLMFASHDSLRDLYEVCCDELDVLVEAARQLRNQGVFGARMTGGGFGGCAITLCRTNAVHEIRGELQAAFRARFDREATMFTSAAAGAARAVSV